MFPCGSGSLCRFLLSHWLYYSADFLVCNLYCLLSRQRCQFIPLLFLQPMLDTKAVTISPHSSWDKTTLDPSLHLMLLRVVIFLLPFVWSSWAKLLRLVIKSTVLKLNAVLLLGSHQLERIALLASQTTHCPTVTFGLFTRRSWFTISWRWLCMLQRVVCGSRKKDVVKQLVLSTWCSLLSMCQRLPPWTSFGPAPQPEYPSAAAAHWGAPKAYLLVQFLWREIAFPTLQEQSAV